MNRARYWKNANLPLSWELLRQPLRRHKQAREWLSNVDRREPSLFVQWEMGFPSWDRIMGAGWAERFKSGSERALGWNSPGLLTRASSRFTVCSSVSLSIWKNSRLGSKQRSEFSSTSKCGTTVSAFTHRRLTCHRLSTKEDISKRWEFK